METDLALDPEPQQEVLELAHEPFGGQRRRHAGLGDGPIAHPEDTDEPGELIGWKSIDDLGQHLLAGQRARDPEAAEDCGGSATMARMSVGISTRLALDVSVPGAGRDRRRRSTTTGAGAIRRLGELGVTGECPIVPTEMAHAETQTLPGCAHPRDDLRIGRAEVDGSALVPDITALGQHDGEEIHFLVEDPDGLLRERDPCWYRCGLLDRHVVGAPVMRRCGSSVSTRVTSSSLKTSAMVRGTPVTGSMISESSSRHLTKEDFAYPI